MEYIQEKITGGGHKNDRSYAKERSNVVSTTTGGRAPAVKKVSRGAIHSGGGSARAGGKKVEEGEEEAGADFLAELRERFAVDTEELASDKDLNLLADDALFAAVPRSPASSGLSGKLQTEEEEETGVATPEVSDSQAADIGGEDGVATAAAAAEQGEEGNDTVPQLLEEIKTMKVRGSEQMFPLGAHGLQQ